MEERQYVVVELDRGDGDLPELGTARGTLSEEEAHDLNRRPGTVVAEQMPYRLIEPLDEQDADPPATPTWGVKAVGALESPTTGDGITVAVLDTGIDATHPAFSGVDVVEQNFTTDEPADTHGHGTHCAGTIAGRDVNGTRIGVAPGVSRLLAGKVLGEGGGGTDSIASAIQWAVDQGASVISMSLGIDFPGFVERLRLAGWETEPATSRALAAYRDNLRLMEALAEFVKARFQFGRSAVLVAAAGNESERNAQRPYTIDVAAPAASRGFISVAALGEGAGEGFSVAPFSNTGADLSGPGVAVVSAGLGGGLRSMSGTSMATPHVAGVAALWAERLLDETGAIDPQLLSERVVGTARPVAGLTAADGGAGMVRAPE